MRSAVGRGGPEGEETVAEEVSGSTSELTAEDLDERSLEFATGTGVDDRVDETVAVAEPEDDLEQQRRCYARFAQSLYKKTRSVGLIGKFFELYQVGNAIRRLFPGASSTCKVRVKKQLKLHLLYRLIQSKSLCTLIYFLYLIFDF